MRLETKIIKNTFEFDILYMFGYDILYMLLQSERP